MREDFGRGRVAGALLFVGLPVYALVVVVAAVPATVVTGALGIMPLQAEGFLIIVVILLGLQAAWFFSTVPASDRDGESQREKASPA